MKAYSLRKKSAVILAVMVVAVSLSLVAVSYVERGHLF